MAVRLASEVAAKKGRGGWSIALTGGSTPKAFYQHAVRHGSFSPGLVHLGHWYVSDERVVPLSDPESNFGNADRLLLRPLGVLDAEKHPWRVDLPPEDAARIFNGPAGPGKGFDVCMLGLGEDAHTASLFPGSPLLEAPPKESFAAIEVPGKGWRLTITPAGLKHCGRILVLVTGEAKAKAVREVFGESGPVEEKPARLLKKCADRTHWLLDPAAAQGLE